MNDHNLDDLIIDNIEPNNSKTKSFLTIIALLIVVLIVAIILTKIILKDPNAQKLAFEKNNTELISPELTLQSTSIPKPKETEIKKEEDKLSTIIENEPKAPVQTEEVAKEVVGAPKQPELKTEEKESAAEKKQLEEEYNKVRKARLEKERADAKRIEPKKVESKKVESKKSEPKKAEIKKEVPRVMKPTPKHVSTQIFYIQVGSFVTTPSTQFLSVIKKSGFKYKITSATSAGTKKLLIGPYKSRASANTALVRVKDRINKSAFVVKK